ncbi:MAG TPA: chemotaxis protein CheW [Candidatus Sulfotelmatobacter sp.]|jgi:chemotaxis signal transduction protein
MNKEMHKEMSSQLNRLADLRSAFDRTFQLPYQAKSKDVEAMIAFRIAGTALAVRIQHITGIMKRTVILPVPSIVPELLGVAVVRGGLVPVFNLATLLELPASGEPQWFMHMNRETPVALAFDRLEGRIEVQRSHLYADETSLRRKHIHQLAEVGSVVRAVIDASALMESIRQCAGPHVPAKE